MCEKKRNGFQTKFEQRIVYPLKNYIPGKKAFCITCNKPICRTAMERHLIFHERLSDKNETSGRIEKQGGL